MSGIVGIIRLDGAPVASSEMDAMLAAMARRGPDRRQSLCMGNAGFGQALLATTPEALVGLQPWLHPPSGRIVVSDSRLDNRPELLRELGIASAADEVGDGELLHAAFQRWGRDCAHRLLGDFAFAIWDPSSQRLFCARDPMGVRPFYFHHTPGKLLVFASSTEALLRVPQVPRELDEGRIADFLMADMEGYDHTSSFFRAIKRLPPAHHMDVDSAGVRQLRYWRPTDAPPFGGEFSAVTESDWIDGLRERLQQAVHRRMRAHGRVGSMLSGGLDSSGVVALASACLQAAGQPPLPTFSASSEAPGCPETTATGHMLAHFPLQPTSVTWEDCAELMDAVTADWARHGEPFDAMMTLVDFQYRHAARQGVRSVMDGIDADSLLSEGNYLQQLVASGQIRRAVYESRQAARFHANRFSVWIWLRPALSGALMPDWLRRPLRLLRRSPLPNRRFLLPAFRQRLDLDARRRARAQAAACERRQVAVAGAQTAMNSPFLLAGIERYDRVAAAHGIEPRHPFLDRQLVEYCAWLPLSLRLRDGYPKWALRQALSPVLPAQVAWRRGKEHLGWRFNFALLQHSPELGDPAHFIGKRWRDYVDLAQFPRPEAPGKWSPQGEVWETALSMGALAAWLRQMTETGECVSANATRGEANRK